MTLLEKLNEFEENIKEKTTVEELQVIFKNLAPAFLYGGYIQVRDEYKVYIRTVEFYFHSEKNGLHDPIVYHRNGKEMDNIPYFPTMTLHAHASGFDITFESEKKEYRASVLIRSYEVKDNDNNYITWDKDKKMFVKRKEYGYNKQSTYLYTLLNGFPLGSDNGIKWVDSPREQKSVEGKPRQNVFHYDENNGEYKKTQKRCERPWSFTREDYV